jgi:hypothetical protein
LSQLIDNCAVGLQLSGIDADPKVDAGRRSWVLERIDEMFGHLQGSWHPPAGSNYIWARDYVTLGTACKHMNRFFNSTLAEAQGVPDWRSQKPWFSVETISRDKL